MVKKITKKSGGACS